MCRDGTTVVVMCDECDSVWVDANQLDRSRMLDIEPPDYQVPGSPCSLAGTRWATRAEIEAAGWGSLIAGEWQAFDERGKR